MVNSAVATKGIDHALMRPKAKRPATVKRLRPSVDWPESWKYSYAFDLQEIYGETFSLGYAYAYQNRLHATVKLLSEVTQPGARVLDIGGAQGNFSIALAEMGYDVTWNDIRGDLADYVRQKHDAGHLSFAPGNAFELEFPSPFDVILIAEIIEHTAHPDEFLTKAARLVRPGGYVIMTTPNGAYFRNTLPRFSDCFDPRMFDPFQFQPDSDGHIFLLHPDEIEVLASKAGLVIDKLALFTNALTNGHIKLGWALRILPRTFIDNLERLSQGLPLQLAKRLLVQMGVRFRKHVDRD